MLLLLLLTLRSAGMFAPLPSPTRAPKPRAIARGVVPLRLPDGRLYTLYKLLIETRPGYWAPAGLYLPPNASAAAPVPAVLQPSGHSAWAWREPDNQAIAANLCARGMAVLGYDPIGQGERNMDPDLDDSGRPSGDDKDGTETFGT